LKFLAQIKKHHRYLFALVAGWVLSTAFPNYNFAGAAWIAPALLLACAHHQTGAAAWRIGYLGGLVCWLSTLSWLLEIPVTGFPILGWVALSAFVAIYPATWVWLLAGKIGQGSWLRRCFWALGGAAAWVALEMVRLRLLTGFPWTPLGASQWQMTPLIQIASVTGVHGVTFLVVWVSLALYSSVLALLRNPTTRYIWLGEIILPTVTVLLAFNLGLARLNHAPPPDTSLRVTFIQPAVPQTMIWDPAENTNRFNHLIALTETALTNDTDLLLWPEAALPELTDAAYEAITNLVQRHHVPMIFSTDDVRHKVEPTVDEPFDVFNAAFALTPDSDLMDVYHKRRLVIFGEYIPFYRYLPFMKRLTPIAAGYASGERISRFHLAGYTLAPLICFEDAFPQHVRDHASADTDLLVNLTNDGWFGESAAQWQQAAMAAFRAVENGLPLLRCCNNGITCWFDANGRMRELFRATNGSEYGIGFATWEIPFVSAATRTATLYNRVGDRFGWTCVGVTTVMVLWRFKRKKSSKDQAPSAKPQS
jgi:apolipoprotein N-acyltransferase